MRLFRDGKILYQVIDITGPGIRQASKGKRRAVEQNKLEPCGIQVDEDGDWFYHGNRIFRPDILEDLYSKLDRLPAGEFILSDFNGLCRLDVADTPFVVSSVDLQKNEAGNEQIIIRLKNLSRSEVLDPETLTTGRENILYCRVACGRFSARFSRPAYYQLAGFIREDESGEGFHLELNGNSHFIAGI